MSIEDQLAWLVVLFSSLSCAKWLHMFGRSLQFKHLATSIIRLSFTALYAFIQITSMPASLARNYVRVAILVWLFDEVVNWIGPWVTDRLIPYLVRVRCSFWNILNNGKFK